ncbi:MAG: hypothetical protein KJ621_09645 [Proteobacteria bacterium]|nr:hypothetical protein [Pseudomonadota bacterium]MBU1741265.1 hypothetical protein [Pseudomonadota bacterium]
MPELRYPTAEGVWSEGRRQEKTYAGVQLGLPFPRAVDNFRRATRDRDDFDPAVLFVWGTMQAKAVLNLLQAAEEEFGPAGQQMARQAIQRAGYEAAIGLWENSTFPEDLSEIEMVSFVVTGINTVLYASLERPWITDEKRCEFDILWCPHQDIYSAFDCRVQRYFVEGMIQAMEDKGLQNVTPLVDKVMPHGDPHCHFFVDRRAEGGPNPWHLYSDDLARRALDKMKDE